MSEATPHHPPLILASTSPRRRELLATLGLPFQVMAPPVDEEAWDLSYLPPQEQVAFLATEKARSIAAQYAGALVIGSDTLVAIDGGVLGKPKDRDAAFQMLTKLQGTMHTVYSGITVIRDGREAVGYLPSKVWMRPLSEGERWQYIETGEPMDKAGAYAIQGIGSLFIERIEGCYFNVMGLSLYLLNQLTSQLGVPLLTVATVPSPSH